MAAGLRVFVCVVVCLVACVEASPMLYHAANALRTVLSTVIADIIGPMWF